MDNHHISVRSLKRDELESWWEMRLIALRDHPDAYGSSFEWALEQGPAYLIERNFRDTHGLNRIFIACNGNGSMLATAGLFRDTGKRSHIAVIWGVYTRPEYRGHGIARKLVDAAVAQCRSFPNVRQVHISVNADNAPARHVYESAGFITWGREPRAIAIPDGDYNELHMAMLLDTEEGL